MSAGDSSVQVAVGVPGVEVAVVTSSEEEVEEPSLS